MRTKNKNHYRFVQKMLSGGYIAVVARKNLAFYCSGFRYAKTASEASQLAMRMFDKKKLSAEVKKSFDKLFKGQFKKFRFEPDYEVVPYRSSFRNGRFVEAATKEQIAANLAAARPKGKMEWWCTACGAEYQTAVDQCTKCTGGVIQPIERILINDK